MGSINGALIHTYAKMFRNKHCKIEDISIEYRKEVIKYLNNKTVETPYVSVKPSDEKKGPMNLNPLNLIVESGVQKVIPYSKIFTSTTPADVSYDLISFEPMVSFDMAPNITVSTGSDLSLILNYMGEASLEYNDINADIIVRVCVHSLEYEDSNLMLYLKV